MKKYSLQSRNDSLSILSHLFAKTEGCQDEVRTRLEVSEDACFGPDNWLDLGEIALYAGEIEPGDETRYSAVELALRVGAYDWKLPEFKDLLDRTTDLITDGLDDRGAKKQIEKVRPKVERALESIVNIAIRCGLAHPIFDAASVADMPFKRPTTIVADTSSVLHGGLDFVVRFLYPMARIKIPAVVHMEILNLADRYFTQRRTSKKINKGSMLLDHVNSQGGQRVLLRLELQTDAEIERPRVGADPLRGIFVQHDPEDKSLGLSVIQRSFADRLVLETALQHRERLSPDHPVVLLTSDQGLARMTLGEGLQPLFFDKNHSGDLFGKTLAGTSFHPFVEAVNAERLYFVPLCDVIWELAVTFGTVRLRRPETDSVVEVCALREGHSWNPYHSIDDLLWVNSENLKLENQTREEKDTVSARREHARLRSDVKAADEMQPPPVSRPAPSKKKVSKKPFLGYYKFSLPSMLSLISTFYEKRELADTEGIEVVGIRTTKRYGEFRNFLRAGGFIESGSGGFAKTEHLETLWESLRNRDCEAIEKSLRRVPSFETFVHNLKVGTPLAQDDSSTISTHAFGTYCALAEICCAGLQAPDEGIYGTPRRPPLPEFCGIALQVYRDITKGEDYVLTGLWLELLARQHGIHPVVARQRLNEARQAGYLERYTEGSTPETQFEKHKMYYLSMANGNLVVRRINLYHGDFLIPERASVSIRLEGRNE